MGLHGDYFKAMFFLRLPHGSIGELPNSMVLVHCVFYSIGIIRQVLDIDTI